MMFGRQKRNNEEILAAIVAQIRDIFLAEPSSKKRHFCRSLHQCLNKYVVDGSISSYVWDTPNLAVASKVPFVVTISFPDGSASSLSIDVVKANSMSFLCENEDVKSPKEEICSEVESSQEESASTRRATVEKVFTFCAAHRLHHLPKGHKCSNLHGHTYTLTVALEGPVSEDTGFVLDYNELSKAVDPIVAALDHSVILCIEDTELRAFCTATDAKAYLTDGPTTSENILDLIATVLRYGFLKSLQPKGQFVLHLSLAETSKVKATVKVTA